MVLIGLIILIRKVGRVIAKTLIIIITEVGLWLSRVPYTDGGQLSLVAHHYVNVTMEFSSQVGNYCGATDLINLNNDGFTDHGREDDGLDNGNGPNDSPPLPINDIIANRVNTHEISISKVEQMISMLSITIQGSNKLVQSYGWKGQFIE